MCDHLRLLVVGFGGGWFGSARLCRLAKDTKLPEAVFRSIEIFGNGPVMPSPHVLEPPSGLSFGELLDWHLRRGTRPPGSDKQGEPWKKAAFASDVGVSDKQVRNWIANKSLPNDIITIERVLFGRDQEQCTVWRMELRDALKRTRTGSAPTGSAPGGQASVAPSSVMPAVPRVPRLSIVVLPFGNLSSDPGQDYFVDGVTEDLTTELSRLAGSFVIAHNTAFTFKGKSVDVKQVARELGVRYVVEGNVRKAGQRVRVGAQLIDAETGAHLWADRFDREISELFELQDAITIELAHALDVQLIEAESRRSERSTNPDAVDLVMRARAHLYHGWSRANSAAAIQQYRAALQLAPDDVRALAELADVLASNIADLWSEARHEDLRQAKALSARALALDPSDAYCHHVVGVVLSRQGRFGEAINEFEAAIRLNPNLHFAHSGLGSAKTLSGLGEEALVHFTDFIRLSPRDPFLFRGYYGIGLVQFLLGDDVRAIEMLRKAIGLSPNYSLAHLCLAAAHGVQGRVDEASAALADYLRTGPSARTISELQLLRPSKNPSYLAQRERLYEGLRKAGMPEG